MDTKLKTALEQSEYMRTFPTQNIHSKKSKKSLKRTALYITMEVCLLLI